ncbi:MAG: hypothetical protein ACJ8AT_34980 [Hyalangium sp.]|uniref:hypothetical protein n=1 Tax=Hyalangium sp. TaxID=2028555 RepID=UPI00389ACF49
MVKIKSGKKIQKIQGGGSLPFSKPLADPACPDGEHVERIYFPEVDPAEATPLKRIEKLKEAGADPFEIAAAAHNVQEGHITHGRQISRGATQAELSADLPGNHQHIKAVCVKCGQFRELDHASSKTSPVECKDQKGSYGGTAQFKNNKTLAERGYKVSYKVPANKKFDEKLTLLKNAGFDVIPVPFP